MINLKGYHKDSFEYHKEVVSKKHNKRNDVSYKSRLENMFPSMELLFNKYLSNADKNNLESILPAPLKPQEKKDLLSLYEFKNKIFQDLKILLTTTENGRKFNICQMCTIEPVGSLDHILPKEQFPEYVTNPVNLFPSCLKCNGKKGIYWIKDNRRLFLNLYFDTLPNQPYLKIEFKSYPIPNFTIDEGGLSAEFYNLLESHSLRLDLFNRFRENAYEVIDPVVTDARNLIPKIGIKEYRKSVSESTSEMQSIYGINHWKSILKLALVNHEKFETLL